MSPVSVRWGWTGWNRRIRRTRMHWTAPPHRTVLTITVTWCILKTVISRKIMTSGLMPRPIPSGPWKAMSIIEPAPADGDLDAGHRYRHRVGHGESAGQSMAVIVVATTTTSDGFTDVDGDGVIDPAGYYSFTNLVPDDYTVVVTDTNNATIGLNPSGESG